MHLFALSLNAVSDPDTRAASTAFSQNGFRAPLARTACPERIRVRIRGKVLDLKRRVW
jgi:hypothetical protein